MDAQQQISSDARSQPSAPTAAAGGLLGAVLALASGVVAYYEGYVPMTYADPIGIPTICYGHTGPAAAPGRSATRAECDALLQGDLRAAYELVRECVPVEMQPHQAAALTSFAFNVGRGRRGVKDGLCVLKDGRVPTITRKAIAGDWAAACAQLGPTTWVSAGGRVLPGLIRRRATERALCEGRQ